jgi:hypothetical protein
MRQKDGFVLRDVLGDKALIGEGADVVNFGKLISLNDTAAWLWEKASELGDFTEEQLVDAILQEYDVDKAKAQADVTKLINTWKEMGVII